MVELEKEPQEFLTFSHGEKTTQVLRKAAYQTKDVMATLNEIGIVVEPRLVRELIKRSFPNAWAINSQNNRVRYILVQKEYEEIVNLLIQSSGSSNANNDRPYVIDETDDTIINIRGISDYKWNIYRPLLDSLRATKKQTESGKPQIPPMSYKEVKSFFPDDTSQNTIYTSFQEINKALAPSGWTIIREGNGPKKPANAPWFLSRLDINVYQDNDPPAHNTEENADNTTDERKRQAAEKRFDLNFFATKLLLQCVSNLSNLTTKSRYDNNPFRVMLSILPSDLRLDKIIEGKTPEEFFKEAIELAIGKMAGKNFNELSEAEQQILPMWNTIKIGYQKHPKIVIFEHFNIDISSKPSDQSAQGKNGTT